MKLKAYKVEPENAESDFDSLMWDEGRRFSIVSDDSGYSRAPDDGWKFWTEARPKFWTDNFFAVWAALENYNKYREELTGGEDVYYYSGYNVFTPFRETAENEAADREVLELLRRQFGEAVDANVEAILSLLRENADETVLIPFGSHRRRKNWRDYAAELLTILCGEPYEVCDIRGCCQGDFAEVVMPTAEKGDLREEIEARYFNTGDGWNIEDESGEIVSYCYTWKWNKEEEQIREYMRGHYGEGVEVELYDIEEYEPRKPIYRKRGEEVAA